MITLNPIQKAATWNSYEASAAQYAQNTANLHPLEEAKQFTSKLPSHAKVIDIGCGPGRDAKIFSEQGFEVTGIDFSAKMIELAKEAAPHCTFQVMDIEKLDFPAASFHGAWANCSLLHLSKAKMPSVLKQIHSLLKPKGILYVSVKQNEIDEAFEGDVRYGGIDKYWSYFNPDELAALLTTANFQLLNITRVDKSSNYQSHPIIKILAEKC